MRWLKRLRARLKYRRFDAELREEIELHRAMVEADLRRHGASAAEARAAASRALGNVTLAREAARGVWLAPWLESLWQDGRYALRVLRKSPGFALTATLTLGAGTGLNVSLFTVFNALALQGWDAWRPHEIVVPFARPVGTRGFTHWFLYDEYVAFRDHALTLASVVAHSGGSGRVFQSEGTDYNRPFDYVQFQGVSANYFGALGIDVAQGRGLLPGEDAPGAAAPVTVVTHAFWQNQLHGDPAVVGRTLRMGVRNVTVTVVGVTRPGFAGVERQSPVALFVPLPLLRQIDSDGGDGTWNGAVERVSVAGRLQTGVSRAAAEVELDTLSRRFRTAARLEGNGLILAGTRPIGQPDGTEDFLPGIAAFGGAVLLVLLLACANVGNLQLARGLARQRELAVRLSLGAARSRLIRQLLTEAACVATLAALFGFALAWVLPGVVLTLADGRDEANRFLPDRTVFAFAVLLAFATAILFALAPALRATRSTGLLALRTRTDIDRGGRRLRSLLLGLQVALSLTLLTGAGLLTRGVLHAHHVDFGFDAPRVASARLTVPRELYTQNALTAFRHDLDVRLASSTVGPTARTNVPPLDDSPFIAFVRKPEQSETWNIRAHKRTLSAAGFSLLGLQIVAGRPHSDLVEAREAVINELLARRLWPGEDVVGRTILADDERYTITGVVRDSRYTTPSAVRPLFHSAPELSATSVLFRMDRPGAGAELRALVQSIEPRLRVTITPVTANIREAIEEQVFVAGLTWSIGLLALCLATIGVFGVFAYAVEERRREIGVRLALGAGTRDVLRALFDLNRWAIGGGLAAGLALSAAAGVVLRSYLFGLSPFDPIAYASVTALMGLAALVATAVPARRALRVDPSVTLKAE